MVKEGQLGDLLDRFKGVIEGKEVPRPKAAFTCYVISNFRGGIGKSTLAFNLAWEISRVKKTLLIDVCPQCNFSQSLLGDDIGHCSNSIYDALLPSVMPGTQTVSVDDLVCSVPPYNTSFQNGAGVYLVTGSKELFLFPSLLYTQLSAAAQLGTRSQETTRNILQSVHKVVETLSAYLKTQRTLIDSSPFFGGATHLAWVAADALIIPVRVDQHSIEALRLTLSMLKNPTMDFLRLNKQAGITKIPKVHALVMTHCGWSRGKKLTPDRSTQAYLTQVLDIANDNKDLFSSGDPLDAIHLLDDFHSAGRISGTERIPLAKLEVGKFHTIEGQRLQVNDSLTRYQHELRSLASSII